MGGKDHTVPASLTRTNFKLQHKSKAPTELKEFPGRSHYTVGQDGWEEVADYALTALAMVRMQERWAAESDKAKALGSGLRGNQADTQVAAANSDVSSISAQSANAGKPIQDVTPPANLQPVQ